MSSIINVFFATMNGREHCAQLNDGYTVEDVKKIVREKFGSDNFRLVVNGQEIQGNNPTKFAELKKSIKNNTIIYVCQRMDNGCGMVDIESYKATILVDLQDELRKVPTQQTNSECMICTAEKPCITYCCNSVICKECFSHYFVLANYKIVCFNCNIILPPEEVFVTPQFIQSLIKLNDMIMMTRNIDFQICICGAFSINKTMYAKQQCNNCQRWFCFFCNANWDEKDKKMRNEKYTCRVNCVWETKITYQMIDFAYNDKMQIPNQRCCPKCSECFPYDEKCKYHTCDCGFEFCFICLKSKEECIRDNKSAYNQPCGDVAQQSFTIFPRLCHDE